MFCSGCSQRHTGGGNKWESGKQSQSEFVYGSNSHHYTTYGCLKKNGKPLDNRSALGSIVDPKKGGVFAFLWVSSFGDVLLASATLLLSCCFSMFWAVVVAETHKGVPAMGASENNFGRTVTMLVQRVRGLRWMGSWVSILQSFVLLLREEWQRRRHKRRVQSWECTKIMQSHWPATSLTDALC